MAVAITGTPYAPAGVVSPADPYTGFAYTPESGSNRMVVLFVGHGNGSSDPVTTCTLGGQTMTEVGTDVFFGWPGLQTFILLEAGIAAMSGNTISLAGSSPNQLGVIAFTLTGVHQTTPTTSPQSGGALGTTPAASAAVTSTADGMVIGGLCSDDETGVDARSHTVIAEPGPINDDIIIAAQRTAGTGGSINPTWTTASQNYAVRTFNVQAAASGSSSVSPSVSPSSSESPSVSPSASLSPSASTSPSPSALTIMGRTVLDYD